MSAESGLQTFRGAGGLWNGQRVEDVATPQAWERNPAMVLDFYNQRRKQALDVEPNEGHYILARLEAHFDVTIVTQNIDVLHERAGSTRVIHLHGLITQSRSTVNPDLVYEIDGWELKQGDCCEQGSQLRPNIVWFGESVPMIETAAEICRTADLFVVVGTSLAVYPAAGLIFEPAAHVPKYIIDPNVPEAHGIDQLIPIPEPATRGLAELRDRLV